LAQHGEAPEFFGACFVGVEDDVVAQGVGWPEGGDRVGREMALGFDAVEQGDAISVEFARLLAAFRVVGNSNEPRLLHPTG